MKINNYDTYRISISSKEVKSNSNTNVNLDRRNKNKVKKSLSYNPKEFTNALLQASKSSSARIILVQIRASVANLEKCKNSGEYNEAQVIAALKHAKKVVSCAKAKVENLKNEEKMAAEAKADAQKASRKERLERRRKTADKKQKLIQMEKEQRRLLEQQKKKNRRGENSKLEEADREYYKEKMKNDIEFAGLTTLDYQMESNFDVTIDVSPTMEPIADSGLESATISSVDVLL